MARLYRTDKKWKGNPLGLPFFLYFCLYNLENGSLHKVCLSSFNTNVKPALEFAVTKLPYYKISDAARLKLKKKYGIIVPTNY